MRLAGEGPEGWGGLFAALLSGLAALLLESAPWGLPVTPPLLAITLFFWTSHRPGAAPLWLGFLLGALQDALSGGLLGVNALALMGAQALATGRTTGYWPWWLRLMGFAVFLLAALGAGWLINALINEAFSAVHMRALRWMAGVLCYIPLEALLRRLWAPERMRR